MRELADENSSKNKRSLTRKMLISRDFFVPLHT